MALDLSFFSLFMLLAKEYMMLVVVIFSTVLPAKKILSLTIRLCWFITQLLQHRSVGGGFFHGCKRELADKEKLLQEAFGLLYGRMSLRFISGSHSL